VLLESTPQPEYFSRQTAHSAWVGPAQSLPVLRGLEISQQGAVSMNVIVCGIDAGYVCPSGDYAGEHNRCA